MNENQHNNSILIKEYNQQLIYDALNQCNDGEVTIVWDRLLIKQMEILVSPRFLLKNFNVTQNLSLEKNHTIQFSTNHVVYFLASMISSVEQLIQNFPKEKNEYESSRKYHVFFIPETHYVLIERLKTVDHIWKQIKNSISAIACHWYPNDQPNFIHLSLPQLPQRMLVNGDWNFMFKCAVAILQLKNNLISCKKQLSFYCLGEWSVQVVEMLKRIENQNEYSNKNKNFKSFKTSLNIDTIVIVDRWLDVLTPMLTQFTFSGAIDEVFKIDVQGKTNPFFEIDDNLNKKELNTSQNKKNSFLFQNGIILKGEVYEQLQDLHLNAIGNQIKQILQKLHEEEKMLKSLSTINDLKNCVGKIQKILEKRKSTENFLKIAELIQYNYSNNFFVNVLTCQQDLLNTAQSSNGGGGDKVNLFIENAIIESRNPSIVLRLIAIQSLASTKGLRSQVANTYRKLFVQSYGIFSLRWWSNLQLAGIIREESSYLTSEHNYSKYFTTNYTQLVKRFRLYYPEVDEIKADDCAYAFNGRASLLLRYFEEGIQNNWRNFIKFYNLSNDSTKKKKDFNSYSKNILDSSFETIVKSTKQKIPYCLNNYNKKLINLNKPQPTIMFFVIGGLTRAEISAIRLLNYNQVCLCASTSVITANSLLTSFK